MVAPDSNVFYQWLSGRRGKVSLVRPSSLGRGGTWLWRGRGHVTAAGLEDDYLALCRGYRRYLRRAEDAIPPETRAMLDGEEPLP